MRIASRRSHILFVLVVALASACASTKPAPRAAGFSRPVPLPTLTPLSAAGYVEEAGAASLFLLRAAALVRDRATDPRLRAFAAGLLRDHQGVSAQLSFAGRRLNLLPSDRLSAGDQLVYDRLVAADAASFDAMARGALKDVTANAARLHDAYARRGDSATLKPVAQMAAPIAQAEARAAAAL